jgi:outer membrane biosynthesis protein TonB
LQPLQNNDVRNLPSERGKGIAGTVIIHFAVLIILVFFGFSLPKPPEEEKGIIVNFGTDETGIGLIEPSPSASSESAAVQQPAVSDNPSEEDAVVTQDFDKEAPEIKKADPEAEKKKKEQIEAERIRNAEIEAERIKKAQEEAERRRIAEEQKRINDIANRTKNALAGSKNSSTNSTGEGVTGGAGNQGDTNGSVDSKVRGTGSGTGDSGVSFELAGRKFQTLPLPKLDYQEDVIVVVEISVNRDGIVTQARPGAKGSTTFKDDLLNAAKDAALKARFEAKPDAPSTQIGSITYNFKLK